MDPRAGGLAAIEVEEGTLRASGVLGYEDEERFASALGRLLDFLKTGACERLVVDLSEVDFVSSSYVRHIAHVMVEAKRDGRRVVVRARERVARILRLAGLDKLGDFEVVDADSPGATP